LLFLFFLPRILYCHTVNNLQTFECLTYTRQFENFHAVNPCNKHTPRCEADEYGWRANHAKHQFLNQTSFWNK
jgi:hypothetical protein